MPRLTRAGTLLGLLLSAAAAHAEPKDELHDAYARFVAAKSFRASVVDAKKETQISTVEFVAPDRYRIRTGPDAEQVIIGDRAWMNVSGRSVKLPLPIAKVIAQYRNAQTLADLEHGLAVTAVGNADVDGEPARVYAYTVTAPVKAQVRAWVAERDGRIIQFESTGRFLGIPSTTRVRYSDVDDPLITIGEPP